MLRVRRTSWLAQLETFPGVPFWVALIGESRQDGPLDFRRGIKSNAGQTVLHMIDGVGGVSGALSGKLLDVAAAVR
jgi:hypothetical protein